MFAHGFFQFLGRVHGLAFDGKNDISIFHAGFFGGTFGCHLAHGHTLFFTHFSAHEDANHRARFRDGTRGSAGNTGAHVGAGFRSRYTGNHPGGGCNFIGFSPRVPGLSGQIRGNKN